MRYAKKAPQPVVAPPDSVCRQSRRRVFCLIIKGYCNTGASYWDLRERLYEMGSAVITVEHGTTEMPGFENLWYHLKTVFATCEFIYLACHPRPWSVAGASPG